MRTLLLATLAVALLAAGCAEQAGTPGASLATPSPAEAAALFAQAAGNVPDQYGVKLVVVKEETELMGAEAAFDEPAGSAYFTIRMDPSVAQGAQEASMGVSLPPEGVAVYSTRDGAALLVGANVILMPPDEGTPWMERAGENEGFAALTSPDALFAELQREGLTVTSVTATTLRGQAALRMEGTVTDEEGTHAIVIHVFQEPVRVARVEMDVPDDDEQFAGARMTMDMLYDDEVALAVPEGLQRAIGLRYESDRAAMFGSFEGYGQDAGGSETEGADATETWTFRVSGGLALAEIHAEVFEGVVDEEAAPLWAMPLAEGSRTADGLTLAYDDADADGTVSAGDTLTITRGEGAEHLSVALKDTVSGYRATPGAGALLALAAAAAAVLVGRRA